MGYILRHSCALVLSRKYKLRSIKKVFYKFGKNLKDPLTKASLAIPIHFKNSITAFKVSQKVCRVVDPVQILRWSIRTHHLLGGACMNCGSTKSIEIHHVRKLQKTNAKLSGMGAIMSKLNRKQIPLCQGCHKDLHRGLIKR